MQRANQLYVGVGLVSAAVELAAGVPSRWIWTLRSGAVIELAADAYHEAGDDLLLNVLVDAAAHEQNEMLTEGRTPHTSRRVTIVVAKMPAAEFVDIYTAPSWFDDGRNADTAGSDCGGLGRGHRQQRWQQSAGTVCAITVDGFVVHLGLRGGPRCRCRS